MKNPIWAASYEGAVKLMAAGCPIDFPYALPHQSAAMREPFRVEQLPGYGGSRVFVRGRLDPIYVIPVRVGTVRPSGTVITDLSLELPWPDSSIIWDHEPWEIIPPKYHNEYQGLFNSRLPEVQNGELRIECGSPVDGLLCATSFRPIEESCHGVIPAELSLTDNRGNRLPCCIDFNIVTLSISSANRLPVGRAGGLLRRTRVEPERRSVFRREIETLIADEQEGPGADATGVGCSVEASKSE